MASHSSDLLRKAEAILSSVKSFQGDRLQRNDLMKQVDLLYQELENPMEAMLRQWQFMNTSTALNVMVKLRVFENIPREGSITAKELGALINLDSNIIERFMRLLTGTGIVALKDDGSYAHTPKSLAYLEGGAVDFFNLIIHMMPCYLAFPEYFKTKTQEELVDLRKTPYSYASGNEGLTFYEVVAADPERLNMFNKAMMQQEGSLPTLGMFPFSSVKEEVSAEPERAFIVDIGGGRGQSLVLIQKETDNVFGTGSKMILQDRQQVIDTIQQEEIPGIEKMAYDFYSEQPVKNAHIYYLRRITHNYQDHLCISILKNIAAAMGPKSRLLITENCVPAKTENGDEMSSYGMDLSMMAIGGKERSEKEFAILLEAVGMDLVKIWPAPTGIQAVIEGRLKKSG